MGSESPLKLPILDVVIVSVDISALSRKGDASDRSKKASPEELN